MLGNAAGALDDSTAAFALTPQAWILINQAHAELLLGRFDPARADYAKALGVMPDAGANALDGTREVDLDAFQHALRRRWRGHVADLARMWAALKGGG